MIFICFLVVVYTAKFCKFARFATRLEIKYIRRKTYEDNVRLTSFVDKNCLP
ncbi:hypothetical protein SAMN05660841_04235 [Sphingobacterium nematocida]|uniref:Uncharacterized protein n=1 Tax=Sphingobacterium nematocida TaxID=1513896 RepID=A0A1T5GNX2_9SPHI|nr:hypothetical protein SAMN05660841_04235 [Sphingobacterium nematocida]